MVVFKRRTYQKSTVPACIAQPQIGRIKTKIIQKTNQRTSNLVKTQVIPNFSKKYNPMINCQVPAFRLTLITIFSISVDYFFILSYLAQIIHTSSTRNIMKMTPPATPLAMYANSLFSRHCLPVNEPVHLQDGSPRLSFTHSPPFSQKFRQTSENPKHMKI